MHFLFFAPGQGFSFLGHIKAEIWPALFSSLLILQSGTLGCNVLPYTDHFFIICSDRDLTQGLARAKHVQYHWAPLPAPQTISWRYLLLPPKRPHLSLPFPLSAALAEICGSPEKQTWLGRWSTGFGADSGLVQWSTLLRIPEVHCIHAPAPMDAGLPSLT